MKMEVEVTFLTGKCLNFDCIGVEIYDDTIIFYDENNGLYPLCSVHTEEIENINVRIKGE